MIIYVVLINFQVKNWRTIFTDITSVDNNFNKIIISIIYRYEIELEWLLSILFIVNFF